MFWTVFNIVIIVFFLWAFFRRGKKQHHSSAKQTPLEPLHLVLDEEPNEPRLAVQETDNILPLVLEEPPSEIQSTVQELNKKLPLHSMWDGFWIHELYKNELIISCSFDRIYYRNFDIIFKGVIFFNVPVNWRDTNIPGEDLLRLATKEEFKEQQPDFDTKNLNIFAIDIHFYFDGAPDPHTFYVVAQSVELFDCANLTGSNAAPGPMYEDPFPEDTIYSKRNKMPER